MQVAMQQFLLLKNYPETWYLKNYVTTYLWYVIYKITDEHLMILYSQN